MRARINLHLSTESTFERTTMNLYEITFTLSSFCSYFKKRYNCHEIQILGMRRTVFAESSTMRNNESRELSERKVEGEGARYV